MARNDMDIIGGVDTHKDSHADAALNATGQLLGTAQFPATPNGYQELLAWRRGFGQLVRVGVKGTGSYGAGLYGYLQRAGVAVREVAAPSAKFADVVGSPTSWTPRPQFARSSPVKISAPPNVRMAASRRCGCCG